MMVRNKEDKIQSLQHSLLFLQDKHAETLTALHKEIERLQQRCSEMTHQMTLNGLIESSIETGPEIKRELENNVRELQREKKDLQLLVERRNKRIQLLEGQLKSKEQKYNDDLKNVQRRIAELEHEVDYKSSTISYLTMQIQQNKVRNVPHVSSNISCDANTVLHDSNLNFVPHDCDESMEFDNDENNKSLNRSPLPPPSGSPKHHQRRSQRNYNLRRSAVTPAASKAGLIQESSSHQAITTDFVLESSSIQSKSTASTTKPKNRFSSRYKQSMTDPARPSFGTSQTRRERDLKLAMAAATKPRPPDYEDFIKISQSQEIVRKTSIEPLPPITTRSGRQLREPVKTCSRVLRSNKATANSRGEIETMVIDANIPSPERTFRKVQNTSK